MADTKRDSQDAIPDQPQRELGACTTAELSSYEAGLQQALHAPLTVGARRHVQQKLQDVADQWASRRRICPGMAGRSWPLH